MHLSKKHGYSKKEILNEKIKINFIVNNLPKGEKDLDFSVAQIIEQKYDLSEDFKPRKFMVKPIKKVKKNKVSNKTKKKKKAIDQEW